MRLIINTNFELLTPAFALSEINKYKKDILKKSGLNEGEFFVLIENIFRYIKVINPLLYNNYMKDANKTIGDIHLSDVPFIACALAFNCPIWSDDNHFKQQNRVKVYATNDMIGFMED